MYGMLDKNIRHVNKPYLEYLRNQPCCVCGAAVGTDGKCTEPHHMITVKAGGADETACPLCWKCHTLVGAWGLKKFEEHTKVILWMEVVRYGLAFKDIKIRAA